ncbi:hypothetical protein PAXINDRAFT_14535 [Paxillus involutus ATCC 200175]|uniref:Uncharacterized protein n=1 Tax=Paxillus involutus ATCC 200175 TaxID=664439 RepID=A0A0C9TAG0_PAXIN|nr:hypothetical protein PAXINDRAFT_14535 [Paxillus involutus ATCC 200175]
MRRRGSLKPWTAFTSIISANLNISLDVTKEDSIHKVVLAKTERIIVVVNNAGALTIAEVTIEQMQNALELNTSAAVVLRLSFLANRTIPCGGLFCAAKTALHAISESLAMEYKSFGIKVMLVVPGGGMWAEDGPAGEGPGSISTNDFARRALLSYNHGHKEAMNEATGSSSGQTYQGKFYF